MTKRTFNAPTKYARVKLGGKSLSVNPELIEFTNGASYGAVPTAGAPTPRIQYQAGNNERIVFQVYLSDSESGNGYTEEWIKHIDLFLPDKSKYLQYAPPRTIQLAIGRKVYNCKLEERKISLNEADSALRFTKATVDITLVEIPKAPPPIKY